MITCGFVGLGLIGGSIARALKANRKDIVIIGPTKRKKVRIVDFGDTLAEILRNARKEQLKNRMQYGEFTTKTTTEK